ncbi:MAG: response regulator [Chloroflexi bacterium]|nr:response regulator [Chloroflexota bacterium]
MNGHATVNILIVDDNDKARARLIDQLRYPDLRIVGESAFGAAASSWANQLDVDVVIVAIDEPIARGLRTVEMLAVGTSSWPVIAVSSRNDRDLMRKAMLAGARDYIALPASGDGLRGSIIRVYQREHERRSTGAESDRGHGHGTVITIFGVKGGIGKTTTAVNIAAGIAQGTGNQVALIDADSQFGDCAMMLDLVPERTIVDAAGEVDPAMPHLIEPYLTDHASRLSLLAAPASPGEADQVTPELVGNALRSLAATNDFVVIDTSPQIDAVTALAIDRASIVLVLVTPEVPSVRRTRAALDLLEAAGYSRDKIKLVLNRASKRAEVPNKDLEEALGYPIYAEIPDDRAIVRAITAGVPVVMSDAKSDAGRSYLELARKLAGVSGRQRGRAGFGWPWRRGRDLDAASIPAPPNPIQADALLTAWAPAIGSAGRREPATGETLERQLAQSWSGDRQPASQADRFVGLGPNSKAHEGGRSMIDEAVEILLVEDNPDDLELALYAFQKRKVTNPIRVARDGEEALAVIFGTETSPHAPVRRPRVILLDLKLPKIDGMEVLRRLRTDSRTKTIPVVVMTSSREERDLVESYRLGVNSYIVKPVDFTQFADVVEHLGLYWAVLNEPPPLALDEESR